MNIKFIVLIPLMLLLTSSSGCEKDEVCDVIALCDLGSRIALSAPTVVIAAPLAIFNTVLNIVAATIGCTAEAPRSQSEVEVFYREDVSSDWRPAAPEGQVINIGEIPPAGAEEDQLTYQFSAPGQYQWRTAADYNDQVPERSNNNNDASVNGLALVPNNIAYSEILTVLPEPGVTDYDYENATATLISIRKIR
jgi:hypothetical protein